MSSAERLSTSMRVAVDLLWVFLIAIVAAFALTFATGTGEMRTLSAAIILPIIALNLTFIRYCRRRKAWSFAGATALGVFGVALRVAISTQPNLEVGGGLPFGVTAVYIVLGAMLALKSYESYIEIRG